MRDIDTQFDLTDVSRRRALGLFGAASFAGLASTNASAAGGQGKGDSHGNGRAARADISVLPNPNFITNARGEPPGFDDDEPLFDPGPVSIPLNEIIAGDEEYDSALSPSLNDGKHQVVRPPEGYDREEGYDDPWVPVTWGEYASVGGEAKVLGTNPNKGTRVHVDVENGLPNGQYTVWVVKFAALADDSDLGPDDPFVTPAGNALVGFHNLGQKFGDDGDSENQFTVDADGDGGVKVHQEGGDLTGIPGFRDPDYPFVGDAEDYEQDIDRLTRIANDLREEDEIHFVGAFHYDDQVWGVYPGPWHVNQFSAVFRF